MPRKKDDKCQKIWQKDKQNKSTAIPKESMSNFPQNTNPDKQITSIN